MAADARVKGKDYEAHKMAADARVKGKDYEATTVCVTGATGFVASSLVKCLLEKGYSVHATVRDPENERKVCHLLDIRGAEERLKLFKADLLEEGSFDAAIGLCDGVFHVASPVGAASINPEEYPVSKTLAEQAALQYGKEHELDVVTIIPVLVLGYSITPSVPYSVQVALSPLTGIPQMLKRLHMMAGVFSLVHVDDLSNAHIFLMENPAAHGRYICSAIQISVPEFADYLCKRYPHYNVSAMVEDEPQILKANFTSKKLLESGFSFKFGIDEILDDSVEYLKTKGLLC